MAGFDPGKPSIARVYDYTLGGKDNFPADRRLAEELIAIFPQIADHVRDNRRFLARMVTWLAGQGISQFIDLGPGLPTAPNTHETAQEVIPGARVVYVDDDPQVIVHLNAVLAEGRPELSVLAADATRPAAVMSSPEVTGHLDLSEPVAVIMGFLLHYLPASEAAAVVRDYAGMLSQASHLVITVGRGDPGRIAERFYSCYNSGGLGRLYNYTHAEFASLFGDLELVPPGLGQAQEYEPGRPDMPPSPKRVSEVLAGIVRVG
jgi:O-methyltransferase involved in polyketide biosynthesis